MRNFLLRARKTGWIVLEVWMRFNPTFRVDSFDHRAAYRAIANYFTFHDKQPCWRHK